jgi:hypothetical protein
MFGRRKRQAAPTAVGASAPAGGAQGLVPGKDESMRVVRAFLTDSRTNPGPIGSGPPLAPGAPASAGAPPNQFVFNIAPAVGPESAAPSPGGGPPNVSFPVPGVGPVGADQFSRALERINQLVVELSGGADLSRPWTPEQAATALQRLETVHAQGSLTEEQYESLKAALSSMRAP